MSSFATCAIIKIMNTQDKILQVAKQLVAQKGAKSVTVTEVAERIGVTHQAAYKHFKSKKQLMEQLALLWLDEILLPVITFEGNSVHDWLWLLVSCKKRAYTEDREMFELYTHYISTNRALEDQHNQHLAQLLCDFSSENEVKTYSVGASLPTEFSRTKFKVSADSSPADEGGVLAGTYCDKMEDYQALIQAFMVFQHPQFANRWDEHFQENFEAVWNLVANKFV